MNNEFAQLPVIMLRGLEGNEPTHLGPIQTMLVPHADVLITLWALAFYVTIVCVAGRTLWIRVWKKGE